MGKVLADTRFEPKKVVGARVVAGDVLPVCEASAELPAEGDDLLTEGRASETRHALGERAQRGAVPDGTAEFREVEKRVGQIWGRCLVHGGGEAGRRGRGV